MICPECGDKHLECGDRDEDGLWWECMSCGCRFATPEYEDQ